MTKQLLFLFLAVCPVSAFQGPGLTQQHAFKETWKRTTALYMRDQHHHHDDNHQDLDRRQFAQQLLSVPAAAGVLASLSLVSSAAHAAEEAAPATTTTRPMGSTPEHPIVILGGGGKVGKLCTQLLSKQGLYCRSVTRQGRQVLEEASQFVSYAAADVTKLDTVKQAVQGADGVIFAASASGKKKGGDPAHVDYLGVYNTAVACLDESVPKLAVVSAGTVTRPESAGYQATNFFVNFVYGDNIMGHKIAGEAVLRDAYAAANKPGLAYTVIRPGGLSDGNSVGPGKVHVSQGDVYSSEIARIDVAQVTVAALLKGGATDFTTFELNQQEGLIKSLSSLPDSPPELIHTGKPSYDALLDGLFTDSQMRDKFPSLMNDFRGGDKILPVSRIA